MVHRIGQADSPSRVIAFLAYAARSGSTRLASELDAASAEVLVIPETRLIELIVTSPKLLGVPQRLAAIDRDWQLENYSSLNIENLKHSFVELGTDCTRSDLLWALGSAFHSADPDKSYTMVFKWGNVSHFWPEVEERIENAKLLCIQRHPCATVNSLLSTERAYFPGEDMGRGDAWHCASLWASHAKSIDSLRGEGLCTVSFETLLAGDAVPKILDFLSVEQTAVAGGASFKIAEGEEGIHRLVAGPSVEARSDAWQTELSHRKQGIVSARTASLAEGLGYVLPAPATRPTMVLAFADHAARSVRHYWVRARKFWNQPALVIAHLRVRATELVRSR